MSSHRLPGKVLMKIRGLAVLALLIRRCKKSANMDLPIVVTSDKKEDDAIEDLAGREETICFRGSLNDVLKRTIDAAETHGIGQIARVCADGPFRLPEIIDHGFRQHLRDGNDYTDASGRGIFISAGLGVEFVTLEALKKSREKSLHPEDCEHVTRYIRSHREEFKLGFLQTDKEYWVKDLNLLLDTEADYRTLLDFADKLPPDRPLEDMDWPTMKRTAQLCGNR